MSSSVESKAICSLIKCIYMKGTDNMVGEKVLRVEGKGIDEQGYYNTRFSSQYNKSL